MQITDHFSRGEWTCKNSEKTKYPCKWIDDRLFPLCQILEKIRAKISQAANQEIGLKITSGYRTKEYNDDLRKRGIGAAKRSYHTRGMAADFRPINRKGATKVSINALFYCIQAMVESGQIPDGGLHKYKSFIHYDNRGKKARW